MAEIDDVRYEVAVANRILAETGLATGLRASLGHTSMRLPSDPNKFIVKGRYYPVDALAVIRPENMVLCDTDGYLVEGPGGSIQCFEVQMHAQIMKANPEVQSVTHVHPQFCVVMSVLGATLVPMCQEGIALVRKPLPVYPHVKTVQSKEDGEEVAGLIGNSKAILLQGHGIATTGSTVVESVMNALQLEEQAKMNWYGYCASGPNHPQIPDNLIDEMTNRPQAGELPHFREVIGRGVGRGANGVWEYYKQIVSKDF